MPITVIATIEEVEYNINEVDIKYSMCKSSGVASFLMDIAYRDDITTFNEVEISVDGEPIFTGFIEKIIESRFPHRLVIEATSILIKAERTWFSREYTANGEENVWKWVDLFLSLAQITPSERSVVIPYELVYEGHTWGFQTVEEALINLAQIVDARMYPDRQGIVHFTRLKKSGVDHTITNYAESNALFSNKLCRNKVTVFGNGVTSIRYGDINPYIPSGAVRHTAISSSLITVGFTADHVADHILDAFNKPMEIYTYVIEGAPTMSLNEYLETPDDSGPITSLQHSIDERGFTTTVTIGEVCPNFFGMDVGTTPFNYTAIEYATRKKSFGEDAIYGTSKISFLKEIEGVWEEHVVVSSEERFGTDRVLAQNMGEVFIVMCDGDFGDGWRTRYYRSDDYGETWVLVSEDTNITLWFDAFEGTFVSITFEGIVYVSQDYCETWAANGQVPEPIADQISDEYALESCFCLDETGVLHIVSQPISWAAAEAQIYYTRSGNFGETWADPIVVVDASESLLEGEYWYLGGVASYDGHVVVGATSSGDYDFSPTPEFIQTARVACNVSHDNGLTWETQTLAEIPAISTWDLYYCEWGSGIWMDNDTVSFLSSGYMIMTYYRDRPTPPENDGGIRYIATYSSVDYHEEGSLVIGETGYTSNYDSTAGDSRYTSCFGGNVAYGQTGAAPIATWGVVNVNDVTEAREEPFGNGFWYTPLRSYTRTAEGVFSANDIWVDDASEIFWPAAPDEDGVYYGPHGYLSGDDYWRFYPADQRALRMSSWRLDPE